MHRGRLQRTWHDAQWSTSVEGIKPVIFPPMVLEPLGGHFTKGLEVSDTWSSLYCNQQICNVQGWSLQTVLADCFGLWSLSSAVLDLWQAGHENLFSIFYFFEIMSDLNQAVPNTSQTRVKHASRIRCTPPDHPQAVRWCIRLTHLTLVCEVIRCRAWFKSEKKTNKKKDFSGWQPPIAFLYLFLCHSLLRLTSFLSQKVLREYAQPGCPTRVGQV